MNTRCFNKSFRISVIIFLAFMLIAGCKKKQPNMVPDPILTNDYKGSLTVESTNTLPPWSVSTTMNVDIDKELGVVTIANSILSYSGDTIMGDSRLQRTGEWAIYPTAILMGDTDNPRIDVDAGVVVQNDVQKIYALVDGNWQLVNETPFNETPNADLKFDLKDAEMNGSVVGVSVPTGSIKWTLRLTPVP